MVRTGWRGPTKGLYVNTHLVGGQCMGGAGDFVSVARPSQGFTRRQAQAALRAGCWQRAMRERACRMGGRLRSKARCAAQQHQCSVVVSDACRCASCVDGSSATGQAAAARSALAACSPNKELQRGASRGSWERRMQTTPLLRRAPAPAAHLCRGSLHAERAVAAALLGM